MGAAFCFFSFSKPKQNKRVFLQISPLSLHLNWPTFFVFLFFVFGREETGEEVVTGAACQGGFEGVEES